MPLHPISRNRPLVRHNCRKTNNPIQRDLEFPNHVRGTPDGGELAHVGCYEDYFDARVFGVYGFVDGLDGAVGGADED